VKLWHCMSRSGYQTWERHNLSELLYIKELLCQRPKKFGTYIYSIRIFSGMDEIAMHDDETTYLLVSLHNLGPLG
jgi:hypothetical protein